MFSGLFSFKGGIKPEAHKAESVTLPIAAVPLPKYLHIPLHQNVGGPPRPLVKVGDRVLKGQAIGASDAFVSAAVHASSSGLVRAIAPFPAAHPSGLKTLCVEIETDGEDRWINRQPLDYLNLPPEQVRAHLQNFGVVGMGGAVFPSHAKTEASCTVPMETLVINGAECEPYITCDDRLMRERTPEILQGAGILRDLLRPRRVLVGVEDNKPEAIAALKATLETLGPRFSEFQIVPVPTRYPAGGAKQLIRVLTGHEIAAGQRATSRGVQCFNVATAYFAWRAIAHGEPVVSRVVTVTGNVRTPQNYEALIGMPMEALLALAEPKANTHELIMGGPMMGFSVPNAQAPVVKATNCLIAGSPDLFPPKPLEMPCIRCGACAEACPHELQPFELYWYARAKNFKKVQDYALDDCIECGCCAYVCPSRIPLVQYFRFAKGEIWAQKQEQQASEAAKARFEFKQFREEREKQEKAERLAKAAAAQAAKKALAEGETQSAIQPQE